MRVTALAFVVVAIQFGCTTQSRAPGGGGLASSSAPLTAVPPPGPAAIGMTEALIANASELEAYWRLSDTNSVMADVGPNHFNGQYQGTGNGAFTEGLPGALALDPGTAVGFDGANSWSQVPAHKNFSLTRTWDYFDQGVDAYLGRNWGETPTGEQWMAEVSTNDYYGIAYGVTPSGDGVAYIDPQGMHGSFQQSVPSTTLEHGEMQIMATWAPEPAGSSGILQPISLVAEETDLNNHVGANLFENLDDHSMVLDLVQTVNGCSKSLAIVPLGEFNEPGDWWFLRFRFDGANLSARAWKYVEPQTEPDWQITATAGISQVGRTAVRYEDSTASYAPIVFYDDFWVQTIGMSVGMFVKIVPSPQNTYHGYVYPADKGSSAGSLPSGDPYDVFASRQGGNGNEEYQFRLLADFLPDGGPGYDLESYVLNLEGAFGAGQSFPAQLGNHAPVERLVPERWYYAVMELDPGDFLDGDAGLRMFGNGWESATEHYRGECDHVGTCQGAGDHYECADHSDFCWMITPLSQATPFQLAKFDQDNVYFEGKMDDVAIFARELSCAEVSAIYDSSCQAADDPIPSGLYATASSFQAPFEPAQAVDGNLNTGWTTAGAGLQSLTVDLGAPRDIAMVELNWGPDYANEYFLEISSDAVHWNTVGIVPGANNLDCLGIPVNNGDGAVDAICVAQNARYLRLNLLFGVSDSDYTLNELEVFACDIAPAACFNQFPVAVSGPQMLAYAGQTIQLDGGGSYDPDIQGGALSYTWTLTGPPNSGATLANADTQTPSFSTLVQGNYFATLIVTDTGQGASGANTSEACPVAAPANTCPASSYPSTTVVTVLPPQAFISGQLGDAIPYVQNLRATDVTTAGNRQAFVNFLEEANAAVQAGKPDIAAQKLNEAIERTDGWSLRGAPDTNGPGRDWIVGQTAATYLYGSLTRTLAAVKTL